MANKHTYDLPTLSSGYFKPYCWSGAQSGVSRKSGSVECIGERAWQKTMELEWSVNQEITKQEWIGGYRDRFECGAAFCYSHSAHMLLTKAP